LADDNPKIDPIRFTLSTTAQHIVLNEEFEIKITAKYIPLNPNLIYIFEGSNTFKLKLLLPDGFKQTGGTFSDFTGAELTTAKPAVSYTIKGKFISPSKDGTFQLLRSHKNADNNSDFILVGKLAFSTFSPTEDSLSNEEMRVALVNPHYLPYMTLDEFRAGGVSDTAKVIYINEGLRSGIFKYSPGNTSPDDNSLVIVSGTLRYVREDVGYYRPEWFGANPDDQQDDADAIQNMFNKVPNKGITFKFSNGTYFVGKQINFKALLQTGPDSIKWYFKVNIVGAGVGRTQIFGKTGFTGDMFVINTGKNSGSSKDNYITIEKIEFRANQAKRILYGTEVTSLKIYDCMFFGGEDCGIQIGKDGVDESAGYSVYFHNNYHSGQKYGGGQINSLLRLKNCRFFVIDGMEADGGKYNIEMLGSSDKNTIINSKLEGAKKAAIFINNVNVVGTGGGGGGENQILNSTLNPYAGIYPSTSFDGSVSCIEVVSNGGGTAFNTIRGNLLHGPPLSSLPLTATVSNIAGGTFTWGADVVNNVSGQTSGATGYLEGINLSTNKILIHTLTGTFVSGETILQPSKNASATIGNFVTNHSYGIKLSGSGGTNIIADNRIRTLPEYGIYNESDNNVIVNNAVEASNGIYSTSNAGALVDNNSIYSPGGAAVTRVNGTINYSNNRILGGSLVGITEPSSNYVDLTTNQTNIGGIKGFVNKIGSPRFESKETPSAGEVVGLTLMNGTSSRWY
jgi:hypothetical protein